MARLASRVTGQDEQSEAADLSQVAGTRVDHAFIGSCGSGTYEDLEIAAVIWSLIPASRAYASRSASRSSSPAS